ncbi:MAG: SRPBCC family protein [Paracoccaceae bacterium]
MLYITKMASAILCLGCATAAWSADYKVKRSIEIPVSSTQAWHLIGDFCDIDDWHPSVNACSLRVLDGSLVRVLSSNGREDVAQKRIARESGLSYTYKSINSNLPIENFVSTLSVEPGNKARIEWSANFSSEDPAMEKLVVQEIETGMSAIEQILTGRGQQ